MSHSTEDYILPLNTIFATLVACLIGALFPLPAYSQSSPDVLYEVGHLTGDCLANPPTSLLGSGSVSGNISAPGTPCSFTSTASASVSAGTLSMNTTLTLEKDSTGSCGSRCGGWGFTIYTKYPANMTLEGGGSASGSFTGANSGSVGYGQYPLNAGSYGLTYSGSQSGSTSSSSSTAINLSCSSPANTSLPGYAGIPYYRAYQSNGQLYRLNGTVSVGASGNASATIAGAGSVSVNFATGNPVAKISPDEPGGMATYPITLSNASYDTDGPSGSGVCSTNWTLTKPDSTTATSSNNSVYTFTPAVPGPYSASILVTDNEGVTATTSVPFGVLPVRAPFPGSDARNSEEIETSCGGPGSGGSPGGMSVDPSAHTSTTRVNPQSGDSGLKLHDPTRTRGFPLNMDIQINNQRGLTQRKTSIGNGHFTYSIALYVKQYYDGAGTLHKDRYLIDSDGTEFFLGVATAPIVNPAGFLGTFQSGGVGWYLLNAGPPGDIWQAGNWKYEFYTSGLLYRLTDPNGNIQELKWINGDTLTEVKDLSTGRKLTFELDAAPLIARSLENGYGSRIYFVYDAAQRITSMEVRDGTAAVVEKLDITYNAQGLINTVTKDGDSASTQTFSYRSVGNGVHLGNISWAGGGTHVNYFGSPGSGAAFRTVSTNSLGGQTTYDYDSNGALIRMTLPVMNGASAGATYTFQNDSNFNVTQISDGATTTNLTYNSKGKVTQIDNNSGGVYNFTYASNGIDLTAVSDSLGTLGTLVYGNSSVPHMPTSITNADGNTWTKTYNSKGQVLTVVPPSGSPTGTTTYEYEETTTAANYGYLKKITNGAGNVTQFTGYNGTGDITSIVQTPETGVNITTSFTYDGAQRVKTETLPDGKQRTYTYNYRKLASITDEASNVTNFTFCSVCGKLNGIQAPLSKNLSWQQDADHRTTGFTDARNNQTQYQYGLAGELKKTLYPDGSYSIYRYDNYGRLAETEDTRGNKQQYAYDAAGRVDSLTLVPYSGSPATIDYNYRVDDLISSVTDEVGTTTYSYTSGRRISGVSYDWSTSGLTNTQTVLYTYNPDSTLDSMEWKDGATIVVSWDYGYDGAGRTTSVANSFGETTSYTYDGVGKMKTQANQNGTSATYTYNQQRGWPTQILHKAGTTPFASYDLAYDGGSNTVGNLTGVTELDGSTMAYTYDALFRLTGETRNGTGAYTQSYTYDLAGNVTQTNGSAFASYDSANKVTSLSGGSISYDTDGNVTGVSSTNIPSTTISWDARNRLRRQQTSADDLTYEYDASGKRVLKFLTDSPSTKTFYVFSGTGLIGEITSGSPTYAYTWGSGGLVSQRAIGSDQSRWYHFGPQGETRYTSSASAVIVDSYLYNGFGRLIASTGSNSNPFKFGGSVGYYSDGSAGMVLATYRWYSADLIRWISRDPIEYRGGDNLYEYVHSNPIGAVDPLGLDSEMCYRAINEFPGAMHCFQRFNKDEKDTLSYYKDGVNPDGDPHAALSCVQASSTPQQDQCIRDQMHKCKGSDWDGRTNNCCHCIESALTACGLSIPDSAWPNKPINPREPHDRRVSPPRVIIPGFIF